MRLWLTVALLAPALRDLGTALSRLWLLQLQDQGAHPIGIAGAIADVVDAVWRLWEVWPQVRALWKAEGAPPENGDGAP